jgi:hypothetical protein
VYSGGKAVVAIPYQDANGEEAEVRFRLALGKEQDRFRWRRGSKPILYGLWRLRKSGMRPYIFLPEGESDTQTLWLHKFPALGLPGANGWKEGWAAYLDNFERIYVPIEPDHGGEAVLRWLSNSKIRNRVRLVKLIRAKDISELYLSDPDGFVPNLKSAMQSAQSWQEFETSVAKERASTLWKQCKKIAQSTDILDGFSEALAEEGLVGESKSSKLLYLIVTSRLLETIVSAGIKGPSSAGKSYVLELVLKYFPEDAYYVLTGMSERALAYSEEPLSHRFIVLFEAAAMSGDFQSYLIRSLLSEGRLIYETVEKTSEGMHARRIEREGPTGLLVTTTAIALHPENETRLLSIRVNDSAKQTGRILRAEARRVSGQNGREAVGSANKVDNWRAFQNWLAVSAHTVVVPYADALAELIPPVAIRLRRDFKAVLSLIQAHALLHLANRETDSEGRIIATLEDYEKVRELTHALVMEGLEQGVSNTQRETVKAAAVICAGEEGFSQTASVAEIAKRLKLDVSAALRRVHECLRIDLLRTDGEIRRGRKMQLKLGVPLEENQAVLPKVEELVECLNRRKEEH